MQLVQYAKGIKTFNKNDILKEIEVQRGFLDNNLGTLRLVSSNNIDLEQLSEKWVVTKSIMDYAWKKHHIEGSLVDNLATLTPYWKKLLDEVESLVRKEKDNIIDGSTLTIRQANALMVLDYCNFYNTYASNLLEVLLSMALKDERAENSGVPKADLDLLNKTHNFFAEIYSQIYANFNKIIDRLKKAPDVEVDEMAIDVLSDGSGENGLKSFATRDLGVHNFSPVFWFKSVKMELDVKRIRNLRESNEMNAMKIEQLMNRKTGLNDPKLDRQIAAYQDRIIKNRADIERIEARYE